MTRRVSWAVAALVSLLALVAAPAWSAAPDEAARLVLEAQALREDGRYEQALQLGQRAVAQREQAAAPLDLAAALEEVGLVLLEMGEYARTEPLFQRALQLSEAAVGPDHLRCAGPLQGLARGLVRRGLHDKALPLYERALRLRTAAQGAFHPDVGRLLLTFGLLHLERRDARAEPMVRRALQIFEKAHGPTHRAVADALQNLAFLHQIDGALDEAEQVHLRALRIREATQRPDHPYLAYTLGSLAHVYSMQGDPRRAEPLLLRALQIREAALGPAHPQTILTRAALGSVYRALGDYARAAPLLERVLTEQQLAAPEHSRTAVAHQVLGELYRRQGALDRAEPLLKRALQLFEKLDGPDATSVADILNNLALLAHSRGALDAAEPLYQRALRIREDIPATRSDVPLALDSYASLLLAQGRVPEALPLLRRALLIGERRLRAERRAMSEARLLGLLEQLRRSEEVAYHALLRRPADGAVQRLALSAALLRKGRSLDELAATSELVARSLVPEDRARFDQLRAAYGRMAGLAASGPGRVGGDRYQQLVTEATTRADALEQELASRSALIRSQRQLPGADDIIARVAARLPRDGALIEFITARPIGARLEAGPEHLLALVLLPDQTSAAVNLGPLAAVEIAAGRLLAALRDPRAAYLSPARELAGLLLTPLSPHLEGRRHLLLSTEGPLHFVPFAALHDGDEPLLSRYRFTYLTSGRDLLREPAAAPATAVTVLADPLFSQGAPGPIAAGGARRDRGLVLGDLAPLPGTRREAERIRALLPAATLLLGAAATEGSLLSLRAPGVLHIATHGLFVSDDSGGGGGQRGFSVQQAAAAHPLLRSALVLAGAQKPPRGDGPDGLATALELSTMDLWGTQLVVLSACDTGRGAVRKGQGVYGLRRAFSIAGAETVVTSLWKVDDDSTADLMGAFYGRLLQGSARTDALAEAMAQIRSRRPHPYYWAPFILLGSPAPLKGFAASR